MDRRRREQERALRGGADPLAAQAALLAADLRAGRVTRKGLRLAALLGEPAAAAVLGRAPTPWPPEEPYDWLVEVQRLDRRFAARVLAAAISRRQRGVVVEPALREATDRIERWALGGPRPPARAWFNGPAAKLVNLARCVAWGGRPEPAWEFLSQDVAEAARDEVLPWALGRGDPLAARRAAPAPAPCEESPRSFDHHRRFIRAMGGPKSAEDYGD